MIIQCACTALTQTFAEHRFRCSTFSGHRVAFVITVIFVVIIIVIIAVIAVAVTFVRLVIISAPMTLFCSCRICSAQSTTAINFRLQKKIKLLKNAPTNLQKRKGIY